jgi:hypothetical protein
MHDSRDVLQRPAAKHDLLGAEFELGRYRQWRHRSDQCAQPGQQTQWLRRLVAVFVLVLLLADEPVGVELPGGQRGMQQRRSAETDIAETDQLQRAFLGAIARLDLLERRAGRIGLDLGNDPPRPLRRVGFAAG